MLKYHKIILVSVVILIILIIADFFFRINIWFYIGIFLATTGLLAYGSASVRSCFYGEVICSANTSDKMIALTFDDGPDETVTPVILDILKRNNIKAAFFCIGSKVTSNPEITKRIDSEGHIIGNHSYTHNYFFDLFSHKRILKELEENDKILGSLINRKIKMFRPPYGVTNPALVCAVNKIGYSVIGWSLKSKDTVIKNENRLFRRLENRLDKGNIILFHDTISVTAKVLDKFIDYARGQNYRFERLDYLLKIEAYE